MIGFWNDLCTNLSIPHDNSFMSNACNQLNQASLAILVLHWDRGASWCINHWCWRDPSASRIATKNTSLNMLNWAQSIHWKLGMAFYLIMTDIQAVELRFSSRSHVLPSLKFIIIFFLLLRWKVIQVHLPQPPSRNWNVEWCIWLQKLEKETKKEENLPRHFIEHLACGGGESHGAWCYYNTGVVGGWRGQGDFMHASTSSTLVQVMHVLSCGSPPQFCYGVRPWSHRCKAWVCVLFDIQLLRRPCYQWNKATRWPKSSTSSPHRATSEARWGGRLAGLRGVNGLAGRG